jgi:hypothetical protein
MDYKGINYDYNDNIYLVTNLRPELAPAAPSGLAGTSTSSGVALTWAPVAQTGATYSVYRSTTANGTFTKLTSSLLGTAGYTDTSAVLGTTYYYRVTATLNGVEGTAAATKAKR